MNNLVPLLKAPPAQITEKLAAPIIEEGDKYKMSWVQTSFKFVPPKNIIGEDTTLSNELVLIEKAMNHVQISTSIKILIAEGDTEGDTKGDNEVLAFSRVTLKTKILGPLNFVRILGELQTSRTL